MATGVHSAGTILLTGATASMRGAPGYAAFAGAKAALRALAQVPPVPLKPSLKLPCRRTTDVCDHRMRK